MYAPGQLLQALFPPECSQPLSFLGTLWDTMGRVNNKEWNPAHILILRKPCPLAMIQAWGEGEKERQTVQPALKNTEGNYLRYWQKDRLLQRVGFTWMLLF